MIEFTSLWGVSFSLMEILIYVNLCLISITKTNGPAFANYVND